MKAPSSPANAVTLYCGELWTIDSERAGSRLFIPTRSQLKIWEKGALAVGSDGIILFVGEARAAATKFPDAKVLDFGDAVLAPGFVDLHVHFPQTNMIGCYGEKLLGWLDRYTFPIEASFADEAVAKKWAALFVSELVANGITTSMSFSSSHQLATEVLFSEVERRGIRAVIGKVSMDRHAPEALIEAPEQDTIAHEALIAKWHGKWGRLFCALTPRFAPSCTEELMGSLQKLKSKYPDLYIQTHFAESKEELAWVAQLFPNDRDYLAVYERFGLVGPQTVLAHVIFATDSEKARLAELGASVAHCPTSNLFLGSGLFSEESLRGKVPVGLGTDVGGGTSFSMWRTMGEAYKIQQLRGRSLDPVSLFHMATLGGAQALDLQSEIGSLEMGKQADFQVLDWGRHRLLRERLGGHGVCRAHSPEERLFAMIHLADDRLVRDVYVGGKSVLLN